MRFGSPHGEARPCGFLAGRLLAEALPFLTLKECHRVNESAHLPLQGGDVASELRGGSAQEAHVRTLLSSGQALDVFRQDFGEVRYRCERVSCILASYITAAGRS